MGLTANARFARLSPYRQMGGRISIGCLRSIGFSRCHEAKTHCASAATLHIREHRASAIKSARNNIPAGASHVAIFVAARLAVDARSALPGDGLSRVRSDDWIRA
jgi:hypothetical protein